MPNKKLLLISISLMMNGIIVLAQSSTNSPYTRYGIGDIDREGFGPGRAMGGISTILRTANEINYLNPASYTAQDSQSFVYDFGVYQTTRNFSTTTLSNSHNTYNIDHIAFSFPVTKWWFASAGLVPFSNVGYNIKSQSQDSTSTYDYKGIGGINQFYFGNALYLFDKKLSLGFNISYVFGYIKNNSKIYSQTDSYFASYSFDKELAIGDLLLNYGMQYNYSLNNKYSLLFGATFDNETNINTTSKGLKILSQDTLVNNAEDNTHFVWPRNIGFGVALNVSDKLYSGFEIHTQNWSNVDFFKNIVRTDKLENTNSIRFGTEYTPNRNSYTSYFSRVRYRIGAHYTNTYLNINGHQIKDMGLSIGLGLPFRSTKTQINIAYEYGIKGTKQYNLIEERYRRVTLNFSFYDNWFYKRKFQ